MLTAWRLGLGWQHGRPHATSAEGVNALSRTLFDNHPPLEIVARQSIPGTAAPRPSIPVYRSPRNLPPPALDEWSWQLRGLCRDHPAEVFFPDEVRGRQLRRREDAAKAICRECPVLQRCRVHALSAPEAYGIWGAMTARERAVELSDES
ncbi:WhiB family transcriptional regulator [Mycolicibacterium setense]|uniref:WhiB family transcriptional regulator n=1 Tax=Mycolicibacterium setense TaxID=431269 RepID=UPI0009E3F1AB|nr:WhiB family transcriptional regulator [Mycolicibacterium setense]MCV7111675.1 WhiB family transcriptional regulator [Mycolicibacterium setense]